MTEKEAPSKQEMYDILRQGADVWNSWRETNPNVRIDLRGVNLGKKKLGDVNLQKVNLANTGLTEVIFVGTDLTGADFTTAFLAATNLTDACLKNAHLNNAFLNGADFTRANLTDADLRGAKLNHETILLDADTAGCTIDRYSLEQLKDYGKLTVGNRMVMKIKDGVAQLRASYSGYWHWIHLTALVAFIFPYAWFLFWYGRDASFVIPEAIPSISLGEALLRFIFNGGKNLPDGFVLHWSFTLFLYMFGYNILRGVLLWKTKQLELLQESSGLPVIFSLDDSRWGTMLKVAQKAFYAYVFCVVVNSSHFLSQYIPLNSLP